MQFVKSIVDELESFVFVQPAYFKSKLTSEYIRVHFTANDNPVFSIRNNDVPGRIFIYEKRIRINDYSSDEPIDLILSNEAETEKDMFQLMLIYDYKNITFEDIQRCNKIYRHFCQMLGVVI